MSFLFDYRLSRSQRPLVAAASLALLFLLGCQKTVKTNDPLLKPIEQLITAQLPPNATEADVNQFLSARGYPLSPSDKPGTLVATIRHIDTERLQPVTARVTFYFDATGKLNTFELQRAPNAPLPHVPDQASPAADPPASSGTSPSPQPQ